MSDKRLKIKPTDVVIDGIVYRPTKEGYGVCTYTEELPEIVVVLDKIGETPVTSLLTNCFSGSELHAVSLPDSLKEIDSGAFRNCKNLLEVKVPDHVASVGDSAFKQCKSLRRLELGRYTKQVGWSLCEACKNIEEFVIWDEVEYIGCNTFWNGGQKLKYTEYSYGLYLGNPENPYVMLAGNTRIQEGEQEVVVEIHLKTRFITSGAFNRLCDGAVPFADIDKLILHDQVLKIDGGAFDMDFFGRKGVKTVCADSIEVLCRAGGGLLQNSRRLLVDGQEIRDLVIPETVTKIASEAFSKCKWLESITFEGDIEKIGHKAFADSENLKNISFPAKVGEIQSEAFKGCTGLQKLDLFQVEKIGCEAFAADSSSLLPHLKAEMRDGFLSKFANKGLKEVIFHNRVGILQGKAFAVNMRLEAVTGMENVEITEQACCDIDPFSYTPFAGKFIK